MINELQRQNQALLSGQKILQSQQERQQEALGAGKRDMTLIEKRTHSLETTCSHIEGLLNQQVAEAHDVERQVHSPQAASPDIQQHNNSAPPLAARKTSRKRRGTNSSREMPTLPRSPQLEPQPQHEPLTLLDLLHKMDFRNPEDLKALKELELYNIGLPMFNKNEKSRNEPVAYSVTANGAFDDYLVPASSTDHSKISEFWMTEKWSDYPSILELKNHSKVATGQPPFPRYVWEIGEIINRRMWTNNLWTAISTGFHLVLDVTSPCKAVWMVFRYAEGGDNGEMIVKGVKCESLFWQPFAPVTQQAVDAAQVFRTVNDWKDVKTPLGSFRKSAQLVKRTGRNMTPGPTFVEPDLEEVKMEIERGWAQIERT